MDNLLRIGLTQDLIDDMIEINSIYDVERLDADYTNTYKIINTLKQLKIREDLINLLLKNYIKLFLMDYNKFISKLRYANLQEISIKINDDISSIDEIFFKE